MLSLGDLKSGSYDILKEVEGDTNAYPASLLTDFINNYYFNIITQGVINIFTGELVKRLLLPFNEESSFYTNYSNTTLTEDCESGDTIIYATTTDYPTTGKLFIDGNIVTYTGLTSTSFTGVTGLVGNFTTGTVIRFAYDLPTDYSSLIEVVYNGTYSLDIKDYNKIYTEINGIKTNGFTSSFGCIIKGKYLVLFNSNNYGDNLELKYNYKPTLLSADADEIIIPDDVYGMCIKYLAVGEMMYNRGEENRGKEVFLFGIARLRELYNYYNNQNSKDNNGASYMGNNFNPYNF